MARFNWEVVYGGNDLDNVQNITVSYGRTQPTDTFKSGTASISGRDLTGFPAVEIGERITVNCLYGSPTTSRTLFDGVVSDIQITYGVTPIYDRWSITCEDVLARVGRAYTTSSFSWSAGITTTTAAENTINNATTGITISGFGALTGSSKVSAQTLANANVLQILNTLAVTEQGYLFANAYDGINFYPRSSVGQWNLIGVFTDGSLATTDPKTTFNDVAFRSYADSYFTGVVVEPEGLATQSAGDTGRAYVIQTYDESTTQAQNLAYYVKAYLDAQTAFPSVISCLAEAQDNDYLVNLADYAGNGARASLILRGTRYEAFLDGVTITASPDSSRFTFNISNAASQSFFILDSSTFGVLDTSKLGF